MARIEASPGQLLARCRFPAPGSPLTCAVSGGADSLALLWLAVEAGCVVTAAHVDHGTRAGSAAEADVVRAAAAGLGAAFVSRRVVVEPGPNYEARARTARYGALPDDVATGHTADDQAETLLLNLLRGSGLDGIAAMRPDHRRPLLALRRAETHALCAAVGLEPVVDPSNDDPRFRRNRVRHELLPLLDDIADRDVVPLLARLAAHARAGVEHVDDLATTVDPTDAAALVAASPVVARAAVRAWLRAASPDGHPPDAATVDRVLAVARLEVVGTDVGRGWRVRRHRGRLRLEPPDAGTASGPPAGV